MRRFAIAMAASFAVIGATRAAEADEQLDAAPPSRTHFVLQAEGGAALRKIYDIDMGVGWLAIGAGADTKGGSFVAGVFGAFGETEEGLGTRHLGVLGQATWTLGERVRLGIGPRVGWMVLDKLTSDDASKSLSLGVATEVSVDVVRTDGFALALGVAPEIHALVGGDLDVWGGGHDTTAVPSMGAFLQVRKRFARRDDAATAPPSR